MSYQGKRQDQIEFSEKVTAYSFLVFVVAGIIWILFF